MVDKINMSEKIFIKNRKDQKISVKIDIQKPQKGLAFVMHGLGGSTNQPHIQTFTKAFIDSKITTIFFDTTNSTGESDGNLEDATLTNYYEDLEDVLEWAKTQQWYQEPFWLAGHSLGAISTALYAEKYPTKIKALAPISTVVSGELSKEAHSKKELDEWEKNGIREWESTNNPGLIKRLKWSHFIDRLKYDLIPNINKLTMPVLMIVGSEDTSTPVKHQELMFKFLPGKKELHIIKGSPHTFREQDHLNQIYKIFTDWIQKNA